MARDDDSDPDDGPRPLPQVLILSELKGLIQTGASLARKRGDRARADRGVGDEGGPARRSPAPSAPPAWGRGSPAKTQPIGQGATGGRPVVAPKPALGGASQPKTAPGRAGRRPPKPTSEERLWASALYHIAQRETSSADLRRLLSNKVRRYALTLEGAARAEAEALGAAQVEAVVARALAERLVDDARYSAMKVRSWRDRGWGERRIAMEMRRKGLGSDLAQDALREVDGEALEGIDDPDVSQKEADRLAAETLCRRKKIGPYRKVQPSDPHDRAKVFRREMGVLARAGFDGDVIRDLLGRPPVDDEGVDVGDSNG